MIDNEIYLFHELFKETRKQERKLHEIVGALAAAPGAPDEIDMYAPPLKAWRETFFQTVEYTCFLINEGFIGNKKMIGFFQPAILEWYQTVFLEYAAQHEIDDKEVFQEWKKFVAHNNDGSMSGT